MYVKKKRCVKEVSENNDSLLSSQKRLFLPFIDPSSCHNFGAGFFALFEQ
jgi:hypothetical protein